MTRRSGWAKDKGRRSTEFTTLNTAVFAPIASARVRVALIVMAGDLASKRTPYRRSCKRLESIAWQIDHTLLRLWYPIVAGPDYWQIPAPAR